MNDSCYAMHLVECKRRKTPKNFTQPHSGGSGWSWTNFREIDVAAAASSCAQQFIRATRTTTMNASHSSKSANALVACIYIYIYVCVRALFSAKRPRRTSMNAAIECALSAMAAPPVAFNYKCIFFWLHSCLLLFMLYFYLKSFFFHFYFFFRTTSANTDHNCLWFLLFIYYCLGAEHWRANRSI